MNKAKKLSGWQRSFVIFSTIWLCICIYFGYGIFPTEGDIYSKQFQEIFESDKSWNKEIEDMRSQCNKLLWDNSNGADLNYLSCLKSQVDEKITVEKGKATAKYEISIKYAERLDKLLKTQLLFVFKTFLIWFIPSIAVYFSAVWINAGFRKE